MDAPQFQHELMTVSRFLATQIDARLTWKEFSDVQLTAYLTTLTKQLDALNDVSPSPCLSGDPDDQFTDKHTVLQTDSGGNEPGGGGGFRRSGKSGMGFPSMRGR